MRDEFAMEYSQLLDNLTIQEYYIFILEWTILFYFSNHLMITIIGR